MADYSQNFSQRSLSCANLVELLRYRAFHQPEKIAYTFLPEGETEEISITYQELDRQSRAIAASLQSLAASGERALLLYPAGLDYLVAFFGCLYSQVIAVPLYPPKVKRNLSKIQVIATDAQASFALTTTRIAGNLEAIFERAPQLKAMQWLATDALIDQEEAWFEPAINPDDLAYLQYTSGSTSTPKGVMISHANVLHNIDCIDRGFEHTQDSVAVTWLPHFHDMGLIDGLLKPLYKGIPCYFMPPAAFIQRPVRWLEAISRYQATHSGGPNFAYDLCARKISPAQRATLDLSSWRVAYNGAEPIDKQVLEQFFKVFEPCGFRWDAFCPAYGMAETTLKISTVHKKDAPVFRAVEAAALEKNRVVEIAENEEGARTLVGCGYPDFDINVAIVNPDLLSRCADGEVGEIWVAGSSVAQGYWSRQEETKATFQAYLSDTGEGPFLRTGDLGFFHKKELFITGRLKDLIIIRGRNLYPQDIERVVERSHPALRLAANAAFSVQVEREKQLIVVQELESRQAPDIEEIAAAIRQAIAEEFEVEVYGVVLIKPTTIPKTTSGKIQRRACKTEFLNGSLEVLGSSLLTLVAESETRLTREILLAETPEARVPVLEAYLLEQVTRVLPVKLPINSLQQPLNSLGLDSLKVFELKNQIETDLGVSLSVADFFEEINLAQLAAQILEQVAGIPAISAIVPISRKENIPLSFAQERLWFFDQLEPANPFYNLCTTIHLTGNLDVEALRKSLNEIVCRHEVLRTTFASVEGQPVQVIHQNLDFEVPVVDFPQTENHTSPYKGGDLIQDFILQEARTPFNLEQDSLLRAKLLQLSEGEHVLILTAHHIVFDGWSMGVFMGEIATLYQAFSTGNIASLPSLPIQYADFAVWQRQWLQGEVLETQLSYWKQQLSGSLPVLNLPTDFPLPAVQTFQGKRQTWEFSKGLTEAVCELSRQEKTTLFMTLLAAFKVLLYRYTGQEDILIGSPVANRNQSEIKPLIGFFVNTLVLRTDLAGDPSFRALLSRVREVALGAYAHQDLPFEKLVEELQPERDLSHSPLFQVALVFQNNLTQTLDLPALKFSSQEVDTGTANFDLTLFLEETEQGLIGTWEYNTDLFQAGTITRMMGHFQTLLEGIVANPEQRISELPVLTETEKHQLLVQWVNPSQKPNTPEENLCIHQLFEAQVQRTPHAVAAIFENQQLTYQELNEKANNLANYLQTLGVKPEVLVGICVERSLEMLVGILAILKAGGAYLPIDPSSPKERLAFMLEDAQVPILLTQKQLLETVSNYSGQILCLDENQEFITEKSPENPLSNVCAGHLAYVIYTSGSTGTPKGVTVTHSNVVRLFAATQPWYNFNAEDVWTVFHSIAFDFSVWEIWGALLYGGKLVVVPYITSRSPADFYQLLNEQKVTVLNQTPSAFRQLIKAEESRESSEELNLRLVIFGGEALELQSLKPWFERHGDKTPQLVNMYGITETTVHVTYRPLTKADLNATGSVIGRPIPDLQVYLLDNNRQPVPIGVPGEMYIGGAGVARGYLNRPELTAERFISNCFSDEPEARLYKSGDLARYLPNGELEYLGRIDHQVKIRGFRIELGEIEAALSQHPSVEKAVVIAREDEPGNKRIVAYLVANEPLIDSQGSPIKSSELRSFLKEKLPEYMVPAAFVFLGSIPLTSNGKIDRSALPTPDTSRPELESAFAAPRTPQQQQLADIWANVLGVKQVGINDNFFELGGHSLLATRLVAKVRETFQVGLPLRCLFQCPTVATLGTLIAQQAKQIDEKLSINSLPAIVPNQDSRHQPFPLTDIQQAYWIGRSRAFELGNVAAHIYVEIDTVNLDFERFNKAWQELVERHDILRAIILPDGQQQILEKVPAYQIRVLDWRQQSSEFINARLEEVRRSLSHQILLCDRWPLFEIQASQLDQQKVRLHFSFDALISDAWSFQILGQELAKLYQNAKNRLNPLQISFRDYVLGEIASRNSEQYQRSLEYWQNRLPSLPPAPELPLAQNPAAIKQPRFVRRSGKLEAKTWQKLKDKATKASITHSGILLAAFAEILTVWSKTPRFTIGLTLFNRLPLHPQVNEIVGDFTSLTLLEVNNATPAPFAQRVQRIQEQLWDDLDHRYVSGVEVLRELSRHQNRISSAMMPVVFTSTLTQDAQSDEQNFPLDWLGKFIYGITQTPQVFLDHQVFEEAGSLVFHWDCVEELFPVGMLDDMFAAYCNFLQRLANETESWQEIHPELLPSAQLTQRNAINATDAPVPAATLHSLFSDRVPLHPKKAAVVTSDRTLTYEELHRHSHHLACRLQQLGARPNTLIAVVMEKGWEQVVACLGILMSGAAYVPIDPALPSARRSHLFAQAEVQIAVTQSWLDTALEWPENLQRICLEDNEALGENSSLIPHPSSLIPEENLAYVIYTSGSTGTPKGVTINHRGAVNTIVDINQRFNVGETDRVFALSSLSFDLSVYDIFGTLAAGGTLVIPEASKTQDPAHWAKLMQREKITIWNSVPALMQMMVEYAANTPKILASLRLVLLSGDWLPLTLPVQIQAAVKGVEVISLGGATEASIWSILYPIKQVNSAWKSIPYGQAMKNQRFYVLNEALEPCPVWVPGQLYIAGIGLAQGYWRDEIKTAASFFTHPRTGEKLYRTGDLGRFLPDGNIEFLGRQDFQVKVGGYRIELGEIESVLMQHPAVREAVVTTFGEQQNKRLVAYIIPESSSSISEASSFKELQNFLKEKLPEYMVPATFMKLDTLPLTSNGKVDRKALPAPNFIKSELDENFVAPQTPVEERLARIWSELLSLEQVGIYDSFFELGGNSLLATQLLTRLRETFQVELPLRDLFEVQTISGLCEKISQAKKKGEKLQEQEIVSVSRKAYRKKLSSLS
ncbi:non-ribosomal peptide synthetase [Microcoleus sp. FACHB-68]|uniref:non-ribosomal peptide synthetase n=1 Tax=Microcoleus sp. FACHB-68 TaxID=2692826 RepID=UPI0016852D90|nr:non-ribosomal peptide synthetase [Microcoleus sp. FACHB-68]MBD1938350.1 amino acid adenylation domain-containing protein [Microcoleus sp. FACHB-68]